MSLPNVGRLLGLDWGEVRIGLALSDETQTLATPLETLVRRRGKRFPMLSATEVRGTQRRRRSTYSDKQHYHEYILQRIEGFKNSIGREELMMTSSAGSASSPVGTAWTWSAR